MLLQILQQVGFAVLDELADPDEPDLAGRSVSAKRDLGDAEIGRCLLLGEKGGELLGGAHAAFLG
nr:hypothetical protein [Lysobacter soli]